MFFNPLLAIDITIYTPYGGGGGGGVQVNKPHTQRMLFTLVQVEKLFKKIRTVPSARGPTL